MSALAPIPRTPAQADLEAIIGRLKAQLKDSEEKHSAMLADAEDENEDYITKLKIGMQTAVNEEAKRTAEKASHITALNKQVAMLTKQMRVSERDLETARADIHGESNQCGTTALCSTPHTSRTTAFAPSQPRRFASHS